jgi:hemolysin activation/secretion protein
MPTRGIEFDAKASRFFSPLSGESDFSKVQAAFSTYLSFNKYSRTVFAFRIGGEKLMGDYVFHEAAKLDGKTNLRGFRKTRFYGDESLYFNAEARVKLIDFRNYFITGELGLLFFNDIGRVWYDGENSLKWHDGYGAGFWVSPFKMAVLTTTFNKSVEENLVQINFSYLF